MKKTLRVLSLICVLMLLCTCLCACSKDKEIASDGNNESVISGKYEDIANEILSDKPLGSDASVLGNGFSQVDFTFTSADDTIAFSLDKNSFVKLALGGTFYNYITPGHDVISYDAGYKTARGVSLSTSASDILSKYSIADNNAVYIAPGDTVYYNPVSSKFSGKLTAVFASKDSVSYDLLESDDVQNFIYLRPTDSAYMNPEGIMSSFSEYTSLVSMDITADEAGNVSEIVFYRFDK